MKKEESNEKLNVFDDIEIMKIKDKEKRDILFKEKMYKIRDLYYQTK